MVRRGERAQTSSMRMVEDGNGLDEWRSFRAKLVEEESKKNSTEVYERKMEKKKHVWAHYVPFVERGSLLIASPEHFKGEFACSFFANTVVLVVHHEGSGDGTMGLILNRPMVRGATLPNMARNLYLGGPVGLNSIVSLHEHEEFGYKITRNVRTGGYEETMKRVEKGDLNGDKCRFFCGYSGWTLGQLEAEIEEGVWVTCAASEWMLMKQGGTDMVDELLKLMGGKFAEMARRADEGQ